ncbi:hypothetical protein CDAR_500851 [Caerostris darwini]|uniref:Uncharacterized protein n=1 Tax=Caerostris darwini TaxID=1538125 RepID=A0AAV4NHX7_9ARAC|nr:hypothetical protein CDAR_500851 [Caerostris darwini]
MAYHAIGSLEEQVSRAVREVIPSAGHRNEVEENDLGGWRLNMSIDLWSSFYGWVSGKLITNMAVQSVKAFEKYCYWAT